MLSALRYVAFVMDLALVHSAPFFSWGVCESGNSRVVTLVVSVCFSLSSVIDCIFSVGVFGLCLLHCFYRVRPVRRFSVIYGRLLGSWKRVQFSVLLQCPSMLGYVPYSSVIFGEPRLGRMLHAESAGL